MRYGHKPIDLGLIDISPEEMMCWVYCPVKVPYGDWVVPPNLQQFNPILEKVASWMNTGDFYVYLTAKTLYVNPENPGNRPGWHSDGFMTNDVNFIWSDSSGTLFWDPETLCDFTQDHSKSLIEMENATKNGPYVTYPDKHLLMLTESVIHRVNVERAGMRTFVKVSVSEHKYALKGNSINHGLSLDCEYASRQVERNCPTGRK